ncbi:nudix hydrolase 18, mitochondrial-like isoform X1 [Apium graveolens]|uniref:nudix hydrolase 18, mitochondrial-like isoform X1 n=1 Tax=Apium graveolens TaxID=4045 RepID=UPI003D7B96F4
MVCIVSRTGRHLQKYSKGRRLVVGCIPYRFKNGNHDIYDDDYELEVLVVSSQKGQKMMFPKGGWELDESVEEAASRESLEEAGVVGHVQVSNRTFLKCSGKLNGSYIIQHRINLNFNRDVIFMVQHELGTWCYKSKSRDIYHEGYMFPLLVTEQLELWPEKNSRQRVWMTVEEAKEVCDASWMKEALDRLVDRLSASG